jgi:single-strand DNA-binding protein
MDLNKVFILGRLTADPSLRTTSSGTPVGSFSVATNRVWNDKNGMKQEETEYHNVVVWGRQAEIANQFLKKGGLVLIEGRLRTRTWQDKQGQNRRTTEIICERLQLGPKVSNQIESNFISHPLVEENIPSPDLPEIDIDEENIKPEDLPF